VPGIEPGPPDLWPRTLTTRPQRRSIIIIIINKSNYQNCSGYSASNGLGKYSYVWPVNNKDFERRRTWPIWNYYTSIRLDGVKKTWKCSQNNREDSRGFNLQLPVCKSWALPLLMSEDTVFGFQTRHNFHRSWHRRGRTKEALVMNLSLPNALFPILIPHRPSCSFTAVCKLPQSFCLHLQGWSQWSEDALKLYMQIAMKVITQIHWRRRQHIPPKRLCPVTTLHGVTTRKTAVRSLTAARTENLTGVGSLGLYRCMLDSGCCLTYICSGLQAVILTTALAVKWLSYCPSIQGVVGSILPVLTDMKKICHNDYNILRHIQVHHVLGNDN
jgi:hypothetical protein